MFLIQNYETDLTQHHMVRCELMWFFYHFKTAVILQKVGFILRCILGLEHISPNSFESPSFSYFDFQIATYAFAVPGKSCQRNTIWRRKEGYSYQNNCYA